MTSRANSQLLAVAACASLLACGGSRTHPQPSRTSTTAGSSTAAAAPVRPHHTRRIPDPGSLPQTRQLPSSQVAVFHTKMRALWQAIRSGSAERGLRAFFPERAYAQVKAIADPSADYRNRLLGEYSLDIGAAHALLGASAAHARLASVEVPRQYAHWVDPGACYNRVGYYEVPNSRIVYRESGAVRSFGIASMISWRGRWYVVHLGAVVRASAGGVVDDPSVGAGSAAASPTC